MPISQKERAVSDIKGSKFLSAKEWRTYEAIPDDIDAQNLDQYFIAPERETLALYQQICSDQIVRAWEGSSC